MTSSEKKKRRSYWLKQLHQWHWISSAICLVVMLLFTITGITLNHASQIEAKSQISTREASLPDDLVQSLKTGPRTGKQAVAPAIAAWLKAQLSVDLAERDAEWSESELYISLPRAGGDAWLTVGRKTGEVTYELTERGWLAYANDLHKGRNTGTVWRWFIDVFAVACLVFCLTGLVLLHLHWDNRPATWAVVGLGLALPLILLILFTH